MLPPLINWAPWNNTPSLTICTCTCTYMHWCILALRAIKTSLIFPHTCTCVYMYKYIWYTVYTYRQIYIHLLSAFSSRLTWVYKKDCRAGWCPGNKGKEGVMDNCANCCIAFCILLACLSFSVSAYFTTNGALAPWNIIFNVYMYMSYMIYTYMYMYTA